MEIRLKKKFLLLETIYFVFTKNLKKKTFILYKILPRFKTNDSGCIYAQPEINRFIEICKKFENENGFLTTDFFNLQTIRITKFYQVHF